VSDQANFKRLRQVARRLRVRKRKQARRLLGEAHRGFLTETDPQPPFNESDPENFRGPTPRNTNSTPTSTTTTATDNNNSDPRISIPSPSPSTRSPSPPSYSPISSPEEPPRPASPANSTASSVEFIEEVYIPPPLPRRYYNYDPHQPLDTLIQQFPQRDTPLPPDSYFIGPDNFDLSEIRTIISGQDPDAIIPVYLPNSPFPYEVPVRYFFNLFPPSTTRIEELPN